MKALVVDDSQIMRRIFIGLLKRAGIEDVIEASNGQEAINLLAQTDDIGLVLLDWNMPIMTGIEALVKIRLIDKTLPVVMVTTESEREKVVEAIKAGANDYVLKPFNPQELQNKLIKHLESARKDQ